jgi:hypothetical protein
MITARDVKRAMGIADICSLHMLLLLYVRFIMLQITNVGTV